MTAGEWPLSTFVIAFCGLVFVGIGRYFALGTLSRPPDLPRAQRNRRHMQPSLTNKEVPGAVPP